MNTHTETSGFSASFKARKAPSNTGLFGALKQLAAPALALAAVGLFSTPAEAQFVKFKGGQIRVTVPVNSSLSTTITNLVTLSGINGSGAALSVSGLPAGASAVLNLTTAPTNNTPITLTLNTTNVAEGVYTFSLNGSATDTNSLPVSNNLLLTLQVAYLYNGGTNVLVDGARNFATGTFWRGGVAPSAGDDVVFDDNGSQSNVLFTVQGSYTNLLTPNVLVNSSINLGSLRFSSTNSTTKYTTLALGNGVTLGLTNANGLSQLRDYVDNVQALSGGQTVTIVGTNSSLLVSNEQASVNIFIDNGLATLMDLSRLDNFVTDVKQFAVGDYLTYPNYFNLATNNFGGGIPRQSLASINLARTNSIKAVFVDPFNFTNADRRLYSLSFMNSELTGSSTAPIVNLGITNYFALDSINLIGGNSRGNVQFNPALLVTTNITGGVTNLTTNSMIAVFRGTNGGRMSVFTVADGGGTNTANSNIKTTVDFSVASGTVDILADRFYIGRDRKLIVTNGTPNYQGFFTMGKGTLDVNTAILGFREYVQTNTTPPTFPAVPNFNGYCEGKVTIVSNGTFRVNNSITLGSTVQTNIQGLGSGGNTEYGEVYVMNGGTFSANTVKVGGPIYGASANNFIVVSNGSKFSLTNTVGSANQSLDALTYYNGSILNMTVDATNLGPYIYVTNFSSTGSNQLQIAAIKHLGSYTTPITLIQYTAGNGSFQSQVLPAGLNGAVTTVTNGSIITMKLTVLTNTPKTITWRGYANANWDLSSANWLDANTGLHTNFANGDSVIFDDAAVPTSISIADPSDMIPGAIAMNNTLNSYVFTDGGGNIVGSAPFTKAGIGGLEVDGHTTFSINLTQGALTGSGSIGSATIAAGSSMDFSGSVGNGVAVTGVANLTGSGSGTISVFNGGVVTNAGEWDGNISCASNSIIYNTGSFGSDSTYNAVGNLVLGANAWFVNSGNIHARTFTVNGTLKDNGTGTIYIFGDVANGTQGVTIGTGGTFIPGGDGIGSTTVTTQFPTSFTNAGRLLLSQGSTNLFKVDNSGVNLNTMIYSRVIGFGPNQSSPNYNGATFIISNISMTPFVSGQVIQLVQSDINGTQLQDAGLNTTNAYPIIIPSTPGPGLAWDESSIIHNGQLKVISVNTNSVNVGYASSYTQVISTNGAGSTNTGFVSHLTWPADHTGWRLQQLTTTLDVGIPTDSTNWTTIPNSTFTNDMMFTNILTTNSTAIFYRMIFP